MNIARFTQSIARFISKKVGLWELLHSLLMKRNIPGTASIVDVENVLYRWEHVFNSCNDLSKLAGLPEYKTPERFFLFLRKLLFRARPSIREVAYLHGFLSVLENLVSVVSKVERKRDEDGDWSLPSTGIKERNQSLTNFCNKICWKIFTQI